MALSVFSISNVEPRIKPRVKRLSNGKFVIRYNCFIGREVVESYINYVGFNEASAGTLLFNL